MQSRRGAGAQAGPRLGHPARPSPLGTPIVSSPNVVNCTPIVLGCLLLLSQLACGDRSLDPQRGSGGAGAGERDGGSGGAGSGERDGGEVTADTLPGCSGDPKQDCVNGCVTGHVLSTRVCQAGVWVCPLGTNPTADCMGTGDCPTGGGRTCTDGASGVIYYQQCVNGIWTCPPGTYVPVSAVDAGAPDASPDAALPATCAGDRFLCAIGTSGGWCDDQLWYALCVNGAWVCSGGLIPFAECRCSGIALPGCVCGDAGLTCPSDASTG
jgi:hypothetical protein